MQGFASWAEGWALPQGLLGMKNGKIHHRFHRFSPILFFLTEMTWSDLIAFVQLIAFRDST